MIGMICNKCNKICRGDILSPEELELHKDWICDCNENECM